MMEAGAVQAGGSTPSAPAGWYANPEGPGVRYWSGREWGEIRPAVTSTRAAGILESQPRAWWVAAFAGIATIIGGFGPWVTAFGIVSVNGTHGDGWLVIAAGCVGLVGLWRSRFVLAGLAGAAAAAVAIADFAQIADTQGVEPAWGIYMAMLGGVALTIAAIVLRRDGRNR